VLCRIFAVNCREVADEKELQAIYRLRYRIYVEEMGRRHSHADPLQRILREPLDEKAIHVAAFRDGLQRPLGALRMNLSSRGGLENFEELYRLPPQTLGRHAMVITRLVTEPGSRGGSASAGLNLARAAYRIGLREGIERGFIDCSTSLVPFFEWLGFDSLCSFEHREFGEIAVMQMEPLDRARLAKTDSPFLPILDAQDGAAHGTPQLEPIRGSMGPVA
jgi:hypothetical protein